MDTREVRRWVSPDGETDITLEFREGNAITERVPVYAECSSELSKLLESWETTISKQAQLHDSLNTQISLITELEKQKEALQYSLKNQELLLGE